MPKITNVEIDTHMVTYRGEPLFPETVEYLGEELDSVYRLTVNADIDFDPFEIELGMPYVVKIVLYEQDHGLDVASVHLNWDRLHVQRVPMGDHDDLADISHAVVIRPEQARMSVDRTVYVVPRPEADRQFEYRALVVCNPVTGPAVRWSPKAVLPERE